MHLSGQNTQTGRPGRGEPPLAGLPERLRGLLAWGGVGKLHLARAGALALESAGDIWPGLARDLYLAAWECDLLDGGLARTVLSLPGPPLGPELTAVLSEVRDAWRPPADLKYFARLAERRDLDKLGHYIAQQRVRDPGNLFWLGHELTHALATDGDAGSRDYVRSLDVLSGGLPTPATGLARRLRAEVELCRGDWQAALDGFGSLARVYDGPVAALGRARALERLGRTEEASAELSRACGAHPWCVTLPLILFDRASGRDTAVSSLPGPVAVLLYTFNKAAELAVTLETLERSLPEIAGRQPRILVLDNGSTDGTAELSRAAADRLGPELLRVVSLPVNVGAPAARNWLMREPEAASAEFVVYMDDDVDLPRDWLGRLAAVREAYPGAGVYGCRVVDHFRPLQLQSADLHLEVSDRPAEAEDQALGARRFDLSSLHHQVLDWGQFDFARPCASVTGCLHLFETGTLRACGDFDLRFSPSQFDDLDHDLRLLAMGKAAVYQGHLRLPHLKRTGATGGQGGKGWGIGFANQYKLHGKYSRDELARMAATAATAVWDDYHAKWTWLHDNAVVG